MNHLRKVNLYIIYEDYQGTHEKIENIIAYDFVQAIRKYQIYLPYGSRLVYARERS